MSELFGESGSQDDLALAPPQLQGLYIRAIDQPSVIDGFGVITPLGGGGTQRNYGPYGISLDESAEGTQLSDISEYGAGGGGGISYNLEGLVGPQGPPGPQGTSGLIVINTGSTGMVGLNHTLEELQDLGTTSDKIPYVVSAINKGGDTWETLSPAYAAGTWWFDVAVSADGLVVVVAQYYSGTEERIYYSTDGGDTWSYASLTDIYVDNLNSNADGSYIYGRVYHKATETSYVGYSTNYGQSWTLCSTPNSDMDYTHVACDSDCSFILTSGVDPALEESYIYKSTNGGSSWTLAATGYDCTIAVNSTGSCLVAAEARAGGVVYISQNYGSTWTNRTPSAAPGNARWCYSAINSTGNQIGIVDVTNRAVYISTNYGVTWTLALSGASGSWAEINFSSSGSDVFFTVYGGAVYISHDYGSTFTVQYPTETGIGDWWDIKCRADGLMAILVTDYIYRYTLEDSYVDETWGETTLTSFARSLIDDSDEATFKETVNLEIGTDVQAYGEVLDDLNTLGAASADGQFVVATGAGAFAYESGNTARTSLGLGTGDSPTLTGLTLSGLTSARLVASGSALSSVSDLTTWIAGTENQITSTDDGDGSLTLSLPQNIHTGASPTFVGLTLSSITAEGADVDKFLVDSTGIIKYRTGAQVLSDIGASSSSHLHDGATLQLDGVNSDGGAFSFSTTGAVTFNQAITAANFAAANLLTACTTNAGGLDFGGAYTLTVGETGNTANYHTDGRAATWLAGNHETTYTHADIALNTSHRGTTSGNPHSVTPTELSLVIGTNTQAWGLGLDDLNIVGPVTGDDYVLIGTSAGVLAWETGATLRTSIGVDAAGTASGLVGAHESTYNHTNYNTAYSHSQSTSGNPHSVTPTELSLVIGTNTQAWGLVLDDLNTLGAAASDGQFIVATGAGAFAYESGATARTSIGLGTADVPQFAGLGIGTEDPFNTVEIAGSDGDSTGTLLLSNGTHGRMQLLQFNPDNIAITFDCYWDDDEGVSGNWISSDAGSNYWLYKELDKLNFYFKTGVAVGDTIGIQPTDRNLIFTLDSTGAVSVKKGYEFRLYDTDNTNYVGFVAPALSSNTVWTTPDDDGTANQKFITNGSGVLSWGQATETTNSPEFAGVSLGTGELTCGSINRASGTLTLEIGGTAELSLSSTSATFGGTVAINNTTPQTYLQVTEASTSIITWPVWICNDGAASNLGGSGVGLKLKTYSDSDTHPNKWTGIASESQASPTFGKRVDQVFYTVANADSAAPTEKMRITGTGKVGINDTNPGEYLDVDGNANVTGVYKVDDTQVIGNQGAAVADATGADDVVAQLNALLARCRAHGLISN